LSDGESSQKLGRIDSVATLLAELLGVGDSLPSLYAWSEDGRTAMAKPPRSWNLLWAAGLALAGGAAVGYFMYTQEPLPVGPAAADLAQAPAADLSQSQPGNADLSAGAPVVRDVPAVPSHDAAATEPPTRSWPKRTGPKIPPLRTLDPSYSPPAAAGAPTAAKAAVPGAAGAKAAPSTPPTSTNPQPTASPGTSPSSARPSRAQEVK
jgi:hypothetical protein